MSKSRRTWGVLVVIAAVFALSLAFASGAAAVTQNPECMSCHSSMQNFTVAVVDKNTACAKCHVPSLVGTHPYHNGGGNCGAVCHMGWGTSSRFAVPTWLGPQGSFASAQSVDTTPGVIHAIHEQGTWLSTLSSTAAGECASCHAPASCSTCHAADPAPIHANHAMNGISSTNGDYTAYKQTPWNGSEMGLGVAGGDMFLKWTDPNPTPCGASGCHSIDAMQGRKAVIKESYNNLDDPASAVVSTVGTWKDFIHSGFSGGSARAGTSSSAEMSLTFSGEMFEIVGDKDPYRGILQIWVDGVMVTTVDAYAPASAFQQVLYRSGKLASGSHTVKVKLSNTRNPLARANYGVVDAVRVYETMPATIAPKCVTCHPERTAAHGTSFSHDATHTAGTYNGYTCTQCHKTLMIDEHRRTSAKTSSGSVCAACHTTYAPYNLGTYDFTCGSGSPIDGAASSCHVGTATKHNFADTNHNTVNVAADTKCKGCHTGTLDVIHADSITTNSTVTDCLTCHGDNKAPTTKSCTGGCHDATGVDSMETHPYISSSHLGSGADAGVTNTGGFSCATCHALELAPEHVDKSSSTAAGSAMVCSSCHDQTYLPRPWNDQCVQCHTTGKAPVPHNAYTSKHDFSVYSATNTSTCGGVNCHDVTMADVIHAPSNPGNGNCTSCHTPGGPVPTKKLCTDCHTTHNIAGAHQSGAYGASTECLRCHEGFTNINTAHPSCATCHKNALLTDYIQNNYTAACTDCHNSGVLGMTYTPADPQHYVGTETTHTASTTQANSTYDYDGAASAYAPVACNQCHSMEMKPEHITKSYTNFTGVPATYPDKCVACHQQRVDTLPGGVWNKTCDACHASKHGATSTAHNGTAVVLSGVLTTVTVESEDFGTSTTWPSDYTRSDATYVRTQNTSAHAGYAAELYTTGTTLRTLNFYKDINLSGYEGSATVSFWYSAPSFSGGSDAATAAVSYNGGSTWTTLLNQTTTKAGWTKVTANIATGGTVRLRFGGTMNAAAEYVRFDDILVEARQRGAATGETAGALCSGGGCHNVADVAAIHNNSVTGNATVTTCTNTCHSAAAVQAKKDCNAAGCHNGGHNMALHTATASSECASCHESTNVQAIHPTCDTCHNNPAYPGIVTGKTAECVSCHKAGTVGTHAYDPSDPNHYVGTETTHTSSGNGTYNGYQCTQCHKLEMKPEHSKATASFSTTTTVIGKCIQCHETKVDNFTVAWDKKCASCHPSTHTDRTTKHNASVSNPGCGGTGCHAINDVAVIHNNSITTNSMVPTCATCHVNSDAIPTTINCDSVGCHAGMQHGHALDLTNSNYNNTTQAGCTNSGSGCHGSQATSPTPDYAIAQYHPSNGCQGGACHLSSSQPDAAFNNPQTCQNCHGGRGVAPLNYVNAPDRVSLTASSTAPTGGHYGETTHTAAGMLNTAKAKADGLTSAQCTTCHNPYNAAGLSGLWVQHQTLQGLGNTTCYDCHSNPAYPGVSLEIIGNWTSDTCVDCHNATDMPGYSMHTTDTAPVVLGIVAQSAADPGPCSDGGCHTNTDLHELHKGNGVSTPTSGTPRPDPLCNVCHDPLKQAWKPSQKSCGDGGTCHITQPHQDIGPAHSVTALSEACIDCHETTDLRLNHNNNCDMCHNNPKYPNLVNGSRQECVDCHNASLVKAKNYAPHDPNHYTGTETTHTASAQAASTYGAISSVVATEGFNSATWPAAWTRNNTTRVVTINTAPLQEGSYYAQIFNNSTTRYTDSFYRVFDTAAVASPTVEFYYQTTNFSTADTATVEVSTNGTTFNTIWTTSAAQANWTKVGPIAVPRAATLTIRFSASTNANNSDRFRVDGVVLKPGDGPNTLCSQCHKLEMKPEHFKASSDATRVPAIYPDKCVDCHENKADLFGSGWDHTCTSCHSVSHSGQTTSHNASAIAPSCGGSGCHYIADVAVIHNNSSTTNATVTTCANTCHTSNATLPATLDCGAAGCHQGVSAHTHELDYDGSLFNPATVTGCVNSGSGCHGNSASTDYTSYHPLNGCLAGACHAAANHNDPQFNNPNTCMNCHGGGALLYSGATDRIPVAGATPDGHYPETTHTAVPASRTASMTAGGTLSARCNQCHNDVNATAIDGLYNQHQGLSGALGSTTCVDCHNYSPGVTAVVTGNWTTDTCADCHNATTMPLYPQHASGTAPVVTATEAQGAGSCNTTGCHTTLDLHALHKGSAATPPARAALGCAFGGCHDYTKQGAKPTKKSCGTGGDCHTTDAHNPTAHNVIDSANCTRCHEGVGNTAATDIRNVYKSSGFGNVVAHDSCASCHNAGLNLGSTNTADCVDCHNATEAGTHAYTPYDPNHYYTASHDSSLTSTGNYGTTTYGKTLTNYNGATINFERPCTTCHTIDLRTEHEKVSVAFALGGKADKCVACHEGNGTIAGVDNWSGRWNGSCSGEANSCHNLGALHANISTKHDASSQTMAAPGSSFSTGSSAVVATEDFGTTATWSTNWTRSNTTYVTQQNTNARSGYAPQIGVNTTRTTYNFYKTTGYALASYAGGSLNFWYKVNVSDTADYLICEYSTTSATTGYTELFRVNTDALTWTQSPTLNIPGGSTVWIRFTGTFNASGEYGAVDDLTVSGSNAAAMGSALPANSTAAVSCGNPSGTANPQAECHNVTEVANIHSSTANNGCPICHTGTAQHPTSLNCQSSGCHTGVNVDAHNTTWHESAISDTTLFGTGFTASWCTGCHDDSIDNEHFVLGAYGSQPCSMCHKKSADSAAPTNVTSADTSAAIHGDSTAGNVLCTTCHKTVTKASPHVQNIGDGGTPGTQFKDTWSGHKSYDSQQGSRTSFTTADGITISASWSLPTATSWLKTGWTTTTMAVRCSDCHGTMTGATGPHGASMAVKLAAGYDNSYSLGTLTYTSGNAMSNTTNICAKCHTTSALGYNNVHSRTGDHSGIACTVCHTKTPHAWKRPRLIGYTSDPVPYRSQGITAIQVRSSLTPTGWSKGYCGSSYSGCTTHSTPTSPLWP